MARGFFFLFFARGAGIFVFARGNAILRGCVGLLFSMRVWINGRDSIFAAPGE